MQKLSEIYVLPPSVQEIRDMPSWVLHWWLNDIDQLASALEHEEEVRMERAMEYRQAQKDAMAEREEE